MVLRDALRWLAAIAAVLVTAASATAQSGTVSATYGGIDRQAEFAFSVKGAKHTRPVGPLNWTVPESSFGTASLGRTFKTYCAEPLVGVTAGTTYRFGLLSPDVPAAFDLPDTDAGRREAQFRAACVRRLFDRHHQEALDGANRDAGPALQVALWEVAQEAELPAELDLSRAKFDLYAGTFRAEYPDRDKAPAFVALAQKYLRNLPEPDPQFAESVFTRYELVRLDGLADATGPAAQDQYALRPLGGASGGTGGSDGGPTAGGASGAAGTNGTNGLGAGGPGVFPNFGGGSGGGGSTGGSSATSSGTGSSGNFGGSDLSSSSEPTGSRSTSLLNRDPPIDPPPPSGGVGPIVAPGDPSAVPAPPGLILGGIGGVLLVLRAAVRRRAKK